MADDKINLPRIKTIKITPRDGTKPTNVNLKGDYGVVVPGTAWKKLNKRVADLEEQIDDLLEIVARLQAPIAGSPMHLPALISALAEKVAKSK